MIGDKLKPEEKRGYFFVFLTGVFFSIEVLGFKSIFQSESLSPLLAAFFGVFGSFIGLTPFAFFSSTHRRKVITTFQRDRFALFLGTFCNAIGVALYYIALKTSELGPSAILVKTTAVFNVLFGIFFLKEAFRKKDAIGLGFAFLGIYLLSTLKSGLSTEASIWILLSAFFFSTQSYLIKRFAPQIFPVEFAYLRLGLLSFFFSIFLTYMSWWTPVSLVIVGKCVSFAFLGFFLGRAFYFEAHKYLPIGRLNSVMLVEPLILLLLGVFFWGESLSWKKSLGSMGILLGIYLLVFSPKKPSEAT